MAGVVAYEIFLLPVAPGADVEEAGEALLARLEGAAETPGAVPVDAAPLLEALRNTDPTLGPAPDAPPTHAAFRSAAQGGGQPAIPVARLRAAFGIEVTLARAFARFRVPFHHRGEEAEAVFHRLFRLLGACAAATDWRAYDPQEAEGVPTDDVGRDTVLEIYLSVMDQLRPAAAG
jgi:hypothetical protein